MPSGRYNARNKTACESFDFFFFLFSFEYIYIYREALKELGNGGGHGPSVHRSSRGYPISDAPRKDASRAQRFKTCNSKSI